MTDWDPGSLPAEARELWAKMATPAHVAQYVTSALDPDAQWKPAPHLDLINELVVDACTDPHWRFLDFEASVRHGKSLLLSGFTPIWYLGLYPEREVFLLSYNEDKAAEWGEFTREVMTKYGPELFNLTVDPRSSSRTHWKLKGHRGGVTATGLGGTITGKGPSLTVIDDPIKNRQDADSPAVRKTLLDGYYSNVRTRLPTWGTVIIAMARWRLDDLVGEVVHHYSAQDEGTTSELDDELNDEVDEEIVVPDAPPVDDSGDRWEVVRLPALAECPEDEDPKTWRDVLGRAEGDPLWPEMWPKSALLQVRAEFTKKGQAFAWDSLYQQNPTAKTGTMFLKDRWQFLPSVDQRSLRLVRWWDLAATEDDGDWTVGMLVGMDSDNLTYVLDVQRKRLGELGIKKLVRLVARNDGRTVPIRMEQERSGSGKNVVEAYRRELVGYDFDGIRPEDDKAARARPVSSQQQAGNVVLVRAPWNAELIEESRAFPRGRWDDQIDCLAGGFNYLATIGPSSLETNTQRDTPLAMLYGQSIQPRSLPSAQRLIGARGRLVR